MKKGVLTNVWHIPKLSRNLFSVGRFTKDVGPVTFTKDGCYGEAKGTKWKIGAREGKGLFKLQMTPVAPEQANAAKSSGCQGGTKSYLWHLRLGHIGHDGLNCIVTKNIGIGIDISSVKKWDVCERLCSGKTDSSALPIKHYSSHLQTPRSDSQRRMRTDVDGNFQWKTSKSEVAAKFMEYAAMAETQTGKRVKYLQSDNGGEYKSDKLARFCAERGIQQRFTPPYTPQLNGVAERMNRTLVECARCMMEHAGLGKSYWGEAVIDEL
uniref:Integrase catalytic domain-containing protein n=1 Tax=Peronospora matthiolae TaxID=2874970 RepID=A0AAV1UKU7_9STRA